QVRSSGLTEWLNPYNQFSASQNGILAYSSGSASNLQLTWYDRSGKVTGTTGKPAVLEWPAVSPDGNTIATGRLDPQTGFFDIWLYDVKRDTASRLTPNSSTNDTPVWSPDGTRIVFSSTRDGVRNLYQKVLNGNA